MDEKLQWMFFEIRGAILKKKVFDSKTESI
jgi:hypothetical protein